jgi:hypothetical protein
MGERRRLERVDALERGNHRGGNMMKYRNRWGVAVLAVAGVLGLSACGGSNGDEEAASGPATVYEIAGTDLSRVELTAQAAERLDIQTAAVEQNGGSTVIPYSAVLYSPTGETWAYISPKALTFVRHRIVVERIDGDRAILSKGPTAGTKVATVGVAELFGAESGLGE